MKSYDRLPFLMQSDASSTIVGKFICALSGVKLSLCFKPTMTTKPTNQIITQDNELYSYSVSPYEMTNALGHVIAILQEYSFTKMEGNTELSPYKLYKTKEGNWYEINSPALSRENNILRKLKTAIDMIENSVEI